MSAVAPPAPAETTPARPEGGARARQATVRRRLRQATDALAVADLLLGMNWSVGVADAARRGKES